MQKVSTYTINTSADVKAFFSDLINKHGLNFHPDTDFKDYTNEDGSNSFTKKEQKYLNKIMWKCFKVCAKMKTDIYGIGVEVFNEWEYTPPAMEAYENIKEYWTFIEENHFNYSDSEDVKRSNSIAIELENFGEYCQSEPYERKLRRNSLYLEDTRLIVKLLEEALAHFKLENNI